jgi:solute carrier family 25 carnitine/acylcarnitine transporter 20/29
MTHNEPRTTWLRDGLIGLGTGILYGTTSVLTGAPFDALKTKMQAQLGYEKSGGMTRSFLSVIEREGFFSLYRGILSPMLGSGLYRASQFAVYEGLYTRLTTIARNNPSHPLAFQQAASTVSPSSLPFFTFDPRVYLSGLSASTVRSLLECPIELIKVKRQTGQSWRMNELYKGFMFQWLRTSVVMVTYFILMDGTRRKFPEELKNIRGQFVASAASATIGFIIAWPLEVLKNQVQADFPMHKDGSKDSKTSMKERIRYLFATQGIGGFYRGLSPGIIRSIVSNGSAMVVMAKANQMITELGWRK